MCTKRLKRQNNDLPEPELIQDAACSKLQSKPTQPVETGVNLVKLALILGHYPSFAHFKLYEEVSIELSD